MEAAALCNPSAVVHPDQGGLAAGELRLAVALRAIGEGHVSSIGFANAVVGPGRTWRFETARMPPRAGRSARALVARAAPRGSRSGGAPQRGLRRGRPSAAEDVPQLGDRARDRCRARPSSPGGTRRAEISTRSGRWPGRPIVATFDEDTELSQRVLLPAAAEETNGVEDARFVLFTDDDGTVEYRATYTAYDGRAIAPRLIGSPDLRKFSIHRLIGPGGRQQGHGLVPPPDRRHSTAR